MKTVYIGIDVSKGYMDVEAVNESGNILRCKGRFDDTYEGHAAFSSLVNQMMGGDASKQLVIGVESTGGLERNWLKMVKDNFAQAKWYLLNPLAVKKFGERGLHQNVTDRISALNIAQYLRLGLRPDEISPEPGMEGVLSYYRHIRNEISRAADMQNELHSLMMRVHPELAQYCRCGFSNWVLVLMQKFPTAEKLAKAGVGRVSKIPHITPEQAQSLIAAAKVSVASQGDSFVAMTIKALCERILEALKEIEKMKKMLTDYMKDDPAVKVWMTFPGIGIWSATALRLEFGAVERFHSCEAAVAYSGLDPRVCQSGDGLKNRGISKRGRRQIRGILYPAMLSAIRHNKVIKEFYSRLRSKGKSHLVAAVACMRKTVSILYAMALTGKPFDENYQEKIEKQENTVTATETPRETAGTKEIKPLSKKRLPSLNAPISRREAKKRREKIAEMQGML